MVRNLLLSMLLVVSTASCASADTLVDATLAGYTGGQEAEPPEPPPPGWSLVRAWEFNDTTAGTWDDYNIGFHWKQIGRSTGDACAMKSTDNVRFYDEGAIEGVELRLIEYPAGVTCEGATGTKYYSSGEIWSQDASDSAFRQRYGKFVARIKYPPAGGHWIAWWTVGREGGGPFPWPSYGEIDIMEILGDVVSIFWSAHGNKVGDLYQDWEGGGISDSEWKDPNSSWWDDYHEYSIEWWEEGTPDAEDETRIVWKIDGVQKFILYKSDLASDQVWPFDDQGHADGHYLILSNGCGAWSGGCSATDLPASMYIDWVRVYEWISE